MSLSVFKLQASSRCIAIDGASDALPYTDTFSQLFLIFGVLNDTQSI
jgi:hypothetical protein